MLNKVWHLLVSKFKTIFFLRTQFRIFASFLLNREHQIAQLNYLKSAQIKANMWIFSKSYTKSETKIIFINWKDVLKSTFITSNKCFLWNVNYLYWDCRLSFKSNEIFSKQFLEYFDFNLKILGKIVSLCFGEISTQYWWLAFHKNLSRNMIRRFMDFNRSTSMELYSIATFCLVSNW